MKTERAEEPQGPKHRKKRPTGAKPRRVGQHGPIGFGSVMHDVAGAGTKGARPALPGQAAQHGMGQGNQPQGQPGQPGADPGAAMLLGMGMVPTTEQVVIAASTGMGDAATVATAQGETAAQVNQQQPAVPTHLGRMTPASLLDKVVSESTKLAIEAASKELHVELEPAHLGPLVVSLKRDPDGRLDVRFRARQADAARILDAGSDMLRQQLADAGFTGARVAVDHDDDLELATG